MKVYVWLVVILISGAQGQPRDSVSYTELETRLSQIQTPEQYREVAEEFYFSQLVRDEPDPSVANRIRQEAALMAEYEVTAFAMNSQEATSGDVFARMQISSEHPMLGRILREFDRWYGPQSENDYVRIVDRYYQRLIRERPELQGRVLGSLEEIFNYRGNRSEIHLSLELLREAEEAFDRLPQFASRIQYNVPRLHYDSTRNAHQFVVELRQRMSSGTPISYFDLIQLYRHVIAEEARDTRMLESGLLVLRDTEIPMGSFLRGQFVGTRPFLVGSLGQFYTYDGQGGRTIFELINHDRGHLYAIRNTFIRPRENSIESLVAVLRQKAEIAHYLDRLEDTINMSSNVQRAAFRAILFNVSHEAFASSIYLIDAGIGLSELAMGTELGYFSEQRKSIILQAMREFGVPESELENVMAEMKRMIPQIDAFREKYIREYPRNVAGFVDRIELVQGYDRFSSRVQEDLSRLSPEWRQHMKVRLEDAAQAETMSCLVNGV